MWGNSQCFEQRVAIDLPWSGVQELLALAATYITENNVRSGVCSNFKSDNTILRSPLRDWPDSAELRQAIGLSAKNGGWFKQMDRGEQLGNIVVRYLDKILATDLAVKIATLRAWIDSNG